ncbi:class I SAM-dependent methyltransferase [Marinivivus vitaminiproducens]|uniref:class I SAM-dependent methyltransferase n=1 Tax=Marinivivus vitaminiproducens TaxID=3035935 RepID=UPI00279E4132|nr:class I SAM-dependent methyltransferase [Geminicoccaceae bacterium SCSIO 64248]
MSDRSGDYDHWAALYNRTVGPDYCREQVRFLDWALLPSVPTGGRLLDLCCGTGQLIAPLLARGYAVTGLDYSADMLRFAAENAPGAEFVQGDARDFTFERRFDGVFCTSASLNHMMSLDDLGRVFASVRRCLVDGGVFVFDVNHPAQLLRYWRGQPAEGEIHPDFAWLITPRYDAASREGAFTVDIYRQPPGSEGGGWKGLVGRVLGHPRLMRSRLRLLGRFDRFRPDWERRSTDYPIRGHDLEAVESLLRTCGFAPDLRTVDGKSEVDERHAAHFVCRAIPVPSPTMSDHREPAEAAS